MRLEELGPLVDYFVLIESIETQRGDPKPLYFQDNQHLFEKYLPKIIHIIVDERHPEMELWEREHYQRNCIMRGLKNCKPQDLIIISDLDEIPRPSVIADIIAEFASSRAKFLQTQKCPCQRDLSLLKTFSLQIATYLFQLNRQTPTGEVWGGGLWFGPIVTSYWNLCQSEPQDFRERRADFWRIYDAGWHFTWMGGRDKIHQKLLSVVEGRPMTDAELDVWTSNHPAVPIDDTFPFYIRKNEAYLRSIGYIADW